MKIDKKLADRMTKMGYDSSFSLILFLLYKMQNNPQYATLSELPFIVSGDNLLQFLDYYGGKTISVPTKEEFLTVISALSILQRSHFQKVEYEDFAKLCENGEKQNEIYKCYCEICEIFSQYDFV